MRNILLLAPLALLTLAPVAASAADKAFPVRLGSEPGTDLAEAFVAAFRIPMASSKDIEATRTIDGATYHFKPVAIRAIGNGIWVLLSTGSKDGAGHSEPGINAIHYLRDAEGGWQRTGEWLDKGSAGTMGNAATEWGFTAALGGNFLLTSGGGVWQGCAISSVTVTELTPKGPVDRGGFTDAMSSGGANQKDQAFKGQIVAALPGKSFTVAYTGTRAFRQQYVLQGGKYVLVGKEQVPGC